MSAPMPSAVEALLAQGRPTSDPAAQDRLWRRLVTGPLADASVGWDVHWQAFLRTFHGRPASAAPPPVWTPDGRVVAASNVEALRKAVGAADYAALHRWSVVNRAGFWGRAIERLKLTFSTPPRQVMDDSAGVRAARWLVGGRWNPASWCFRADADKPAILWVTERAAQAEAWSYRRLETLARRVAAGFTAAGFRPGDAVALFMPMTPECVAAYLGIVLAGGSVVSIADSFAPPEVAARLRIAEAKAIVVMASFARQGTTVDLYAKAVAAKAPRAIVLPGPAGVTGALREGDTTWEEFLRPASAARVHEAGPEHVTNILFSSGTTGEPKAIPWTNLTPIKAAVDGHLHQDIHADDVVAWPTNIGWMMGPWLIYATLVNGATMALYEGAPTGEGFVRFIDTARVSVLGLVPAIVRRWFESGVAAGKDWSSVRLFTSTGESSNTHDYLWLMHLAKYRAPVIEYCGGTEIGGGHLTGSLAQPASPATFSTPALGIDVLVLDADARPVPVGAMGELYLVPPSIGLSQRLLNRDHDATYFEGCPPGPGGEVLRRHGDEVEVLGGGYYRAHGRADDTMNLGGIKVSSVELERVMNAHPDLSETAAVAVVPEEGGADRLVVFAVPRAGAPDASALKAGLQKRIKDELNPLFKIDDVVLVGALPRTASNKILRRQLRQQHAAQGLGRKA